MEESPRMERQGSPRGAGMPRKRKESSQVIWEKILLFMVDAPVFVACSYPLFSSKEVRPHPVISLTGADRG